MEIREASISDIRQIVDLWIELMDYHKDLDPLFTQAKNAPELFKTHLSKQMKSADSMIYVAEEFGEVIGYALVSISEYPPVFIRRKYGMISDVAVAKGNRKKGIGKMLFQRVQQWLSLKGIKRIELRVADVNGNACVFWRKMGFLPYMTTMYREEEN